MAPKKNKTGSHKQRQRKAKQAQAEEEAQWEPEEVKKEVILAWVNTQKAEDQAEGKKEDDKADKGWSKTQKEWWPAKKKDWPEKKEDDKAVSKDKEKTKGWTSGNWFADKAKDQAWKMSEPGPPAGPPPSKWCEVCQQKAYEGKGHCSTSWCSVKGWLSPAENASFCNAARLKRQQQLEDKKGKDKKA